MIEKFTLQEQGIIESGEVLTLDMVVEMLNDFYDENMELRGENERLKAQLYCDSDEGVCIICEHHFLVKGKTYEKYFISKCRKGHEECSTEMLKYCDDFELNDSDGGV